MTLLEPLFPVLVCPKRYPGSFLGGVFAAAVVAGAIGGERPALAAEPAVPESNSGFHQRLLATKSAEGVRARIAGLPVKEINLNEVVEAAINRNLDILQAAESVGVARSAVTQSDAVFDPTIFGSLSYSNKFFVKRKDFVDRFRDNPNYFAELVAEQKEKQDNGDYSTQGSQTVICSVTGDDLPNGSITLTNGSTDSTAPACFQAPQWGYQEEDAVSDSLSQHKATGSIGIGKQFLVGPVVQLTLSSTWRKKGYFSTSGTPPMSVAYYPDGLTYDPYGWNGKLFWSSNATLSVTLPLPFTKGFGEEGSTAAYSLAVSELSAKRSGFSEKSQRNQRLADSLQAYWDLVRVANDIQVRADLRQAITDRLAAQKRLVESGVATRYDVNQVEVQLAGLDVSDEADWNLLVTSSNRLLTLLAAEQRALLIPANPEATLTAGLPPGLLGGTAAAAGGSSEADLAAATADAPGTIRLQYASLEPAAGAAGAAASQAAEGGALGEILKNHPDIKLQEQNYEISKTTLAYRENQSLPDISLSASASTAESDAVFGYGNLGQSLTHLIHPDTANFTVAVHYRYPLWNNAAEAALSRARIEERQTWNQVRDVRQSVTIAIDRATADLKSSQALARQSNEDVNLASFAFDRAREQRDLGLISEFEVLNRYSALLSARLNRSTALANVQKAHVRLLAAQGVLESRYGR